MFRYLSKRTIKYDYYFKREISESIKNITIIDNEVNNNSISKKQYSFNNLSLVQSISVNNFLVKTQYKNFASGKWNLYRFNRDVNKYSLKDFTKSPLTKEWLNRRKENFRSNLEVNKLSTTIDQLTNKNKKVELNPIFSPNKRKLNKVLRKKIIKNINQAQSEDFKSLETRLFLKDMNSQSLENLRKIKENKIFNKKLHELHERKLAVKLESKKLENLIENFDFRFKNYETYNDTEGNSFKNYTLIDFTQEGKMIYGKSLDVKNPLHNKKYEAPYKIQTRFNEFIENKKQLDNMRIESLLSYKKSNPELNKYLYLNSAEAINGSKFLEKSEYKIQEKNIEDSDEQITYDKKISNKEDNCTFNHSTETFLNYRTHEHPNSDSIHVETPISTKTINLNDEYHPEFNNILGKSGKNSDNSNDITVEIKDNQNNLLSLNDPQVDNNSKNNTSLDNYFKKHIELKSKINNYETELYNDYRNLDLYNKYHKGIINFSELSLEENLNYVKFNLKNTEDLFKMYLEVKSIDNSLIFGSMIQKLAVSLKTDKDIQKTLNIYEYKDLLRDFKKNFRSLDNKNFVDSIYAIGKIHKNKREFSQKFFQHLLDEMLQEAAERTQTFKIEEIAFLCEGINFLNINDNSDDLTIVAKKNCLLDNIFKYLIPKNELESDNSEINASASKNIHKSGLSENQINKFLMNRPNKNESIMKYENSPISKLKYLHHAASIIKCYNFLNNNLTNREYVELLNFFSVPILKIVDEKSVELVDEVDFRHLKYLISCYSSGLAKLRNFRDNIIIIDSQSQSNVNKFNYNNSDLIKRLNSSFDGLLNEKEFIQKEKLEIQERIDNMGKMLVDLSKKAKEKEDSPNELLLMNVNISKRNDLAMLENPRNNFLEVMNFLTRATYYKINQLEIKDISEILFSIANAKVFDYKVFIRKMRKKIVDEIEKGRDYELKHITKYFWGLSQVKTKFFVPEYNKDFNSIIYPRMTKKIKSANFVEINKLKYSIFEIKNLVDNKQLSLLLYSLANMGYSDPEFFIPIFNNLIQYDKMYYLNPALKGEKNHENKNKTDYKFTLKDIGFYLNSLAFLNYNDEVLLKFLLNKLHKIFINENNGSSTSHRISINESILNVNKNNESAISMFLISIVHMNGKRILRGLKHWQALILSIIKYCKDNYTEQNSKDLVSLLWFVAHIELVDEIDFEFFMNIISKNLKGLSKYDKVMLNQTLLLLFRKNEFAFKSTNFGLEQMKELNAYSLDYEKSRSLLKKKFAENHHEEKSSSELVKAILEKNKNYLLKLGIIFQTDYMIENSYIADVYIKNKNLVIEVYDHYEILKNKSLTGYNEIKQEIYEILGYKTTQIYSNDYEFLICKENDEKLFEYLLKKFEIE